MRNNRTGIQGRAHTSPIAAMMAVAGVLAFAPMARAQVVTWSGGGGSSNWSSNGNWAGGVAPVETVGSVQQLDFTGTTGLTPNMNHSYYVNALTFDSAAGVFDIGGATKTLTFDGTTPTVSQQSASNELISVNTVDFSTNGIVDVTGVGSLTISSTLTDVGNISKQGAGMLELSGANSAYTGAITVAGGTLSVSTDDSVLGTGSTTVASGATLQITDGRTLANAISLTGTGVGGIGALDSEAGASTTATLSNAVALGGATAVKSGSGTLVLSGGVTGSGDNLTFSGAGNTTISSAIATAAGTVTLNGAGTTIFSGANTYTGVTTVNAGVLDLNTTAVKGNLTINAGLVNDNASNQLAATSNLTIAGGTFNLGTQSETVASLSGAAAGTLALGTGTLTDSGAASSTFGGLITGTGTLDKSSTGTLTLSGTSAGFTGSVNVTNGTIAATANNATGTAAVAVSGTGNFQLQGGTSQGSNFTLSSSAGNGAVENASGNNTVAGTVTVSANSRIQSDAGTLTVSGAVGIGANTLNVGGNSNTTISGAITGTAASKISKDGTGTLAIGAANPSFAGSVLVSNGTLQMNVSNAFTNSTAITVNTGAVMNLNGTSQTIGTLADAGSLAFGAASTLTLFSGASTLNGTLSGTGTLILDTGSTLTLGANFNDAGLNITLAGGTLKLNGTTDTFGTLNVTSTSIVDFANPSTSILTVNGVTLSGGVQLSVKNWANGVDYFYSNTSPGTMGSAPINQIVFTGNPGNYTHWATYTSGPDSGHEVTPVPEPATYGAIFVGISLAGIVLYRRKRGAAHVHETLPDAGILGENSAVLKGLATIV